MKHLLLCLATSFILTFPVHSQQYFPFPDSNTIWFVQDVHLEEPPPIPFDTYFLEGDTLIANAQYSKVYVWYGNDTILLGGIREDSTKKIFFTRFADDFGFSCLTVIPDTLNEMVLYDFGLGVGDTSYFFDPILFSPNDECYHPRIILDVDSILVLGSYRKRYWVTGEPWANDYWIEGIGSDWGLLGPYVRVFENYSTLCMFEQEGERWVNPTGCVTGIENQVTPSISVSIYPNPTHNELNIRISNAYTEHFEIEILNSLGLKIAQEEISSSASLTNWSYAAGIYWLRIEADNNLIAIRKIIIM